MHQTSKRDELIFTIVFLAILFGVSYLPLGRPWKIAATSSISVLGLLIYFVLFRELNRGRWLKTALAFALGLAIGAGGVVLVRTL
jgi:hypothetical protein